MVNEFIMHILSFLLQGNLFFFCRFLIGREKPGTQSEVARLISETLEQERCLYEQHYVHDDTEQVKYHTHLHIFRSTRLHVTCSNFLKWNKLFLKIQGKKRDKTGNLLKTENTNFIHC